MAELKYTYTIGRRKTAAATLRLFETGGENIVNEKALNKYFCRSIHVSNILEVFKVAGLKAADYYFTVKVHGSGISAQSEAVKHALARAVAKSNPDLKKVIKQAGLLTRDPRMVERKKPGLHKARKAEQYSKR